MRPLLHRIGQGLFGIMTGVGDVHRLELYVFPTEFECRRRQRKEVGMVNAAALRFRLQHTGVQKFDAELGGGDVADPPEEMAGVVGRLASEKDEIPLRKRVVSWT